MKAIKSKSTLKAKEVKFLGFKYSRVGDVALLKFLNTEIWAKVGDKYNFIGLSYIRKIKEYFKR